MIEFGDLRLYTVDDLAEKLDAHINTVREWIHSGKIQGKKLGKRWYVTEEALRCYFLESDGRPSGEEETELTKVFTSGRVIAEQDGRNG
ncbi:MAG: helix-turn-helix domain-containing protein [Pirellulales bacterium]|jgi:excisionase family DNA binding protein|nr:helix-turn-helix domain-containing protein [Pirellulales bacterium]